MRQNRNHVLSSWIQIPCRIKAFRCTSQKRSCAVEQRSSGHSGRPNTIYRDKLQECFARKQSPFGDETAMIRTADEGIVKRHNLPANDVSLKNEARQRTDFARLGTIAILRIT